MLFFSDTEAEKSEWEKMENPNTPSTEEIIWTYETVYIFQFLVPKESIV